MCFILWNLFSKCIQGRLDCIGETVLVKGEILLNNSIMVSASIYNVFSVLSLTFCNILVFCMFLPSPWNMLVIDNSCLCKNVTRLAEFFKRWRYFPKLTSYLLPHPWTVGGQKQKLKETINERHMLPSEMLYSVLQLLMTSLLLSLNYLPKIFSSSIDCPAPMYYFNCSSAGPGAIGSECQKSCKTQDMHCVRTSPPSRSMGQHDYACMIVLNKHWR